MDIHSFIKNSKKFNDIRKRDYEVLLVFYIDDNDEPQLAAMTSSSKDNKKTVEFNRKILKYEREKTGHRKFFILHNHPESEHENYHYFSLQDVIAYNNIMAEIKGTDIELLDFYVISPKGDFSMKALSSIF